MRKEQLISHWFSKFETMTLDEYTALSKISDEELDKIVPKKRAKKKCSERIAAREADIITRWHKRHTPAGRMKRNSVNAIARKHKCSRATVREHTARLRRTGKLPRMKKRAELFNW